MGAGQSNARINRPDGVWPGSHRASPGLISRKAGLRDSWRLDTLVLWAGAFDARLRSEYGSDHVPKGEPGLEKERSPQGSTHPDARTFAADRLLESERMALAAAAGPLALLITQIGTLAAADIWIKSLATLTFLCLVYCCIWQVLIINYATYWLAAERLGASSSEPLAGRGLVRAFQTQESFTEAGLTRLIRRSRLHYSVTYWIGGVSGAGVVLALIWY
jgi:hypothetical protein